MKRKDWVLFGTFTFLLLAAISVPYWLWMLPALRSLGD